MPYTVYQYLHLLGAFMAVTAVAGVAVHAASGGSRKNNRMRGQLAALHGMGLILVLLAGFGMVGGNLPGWVWAKLIIWLVLGAGMTLCYRSKALARAMVVGLPVLMLAAVWLVRARPF